MKSNCHIHNSLSLKSCPNPSTQFNSLLDYGIIVRIERFLCTPSSLKKLRPTSNLESPEACGNCAPVLSCMSLTHFLSQGFVYRVLGTPAFFATSLNRRFRKRVFDPHHIYQISLTQCEDCSMTFVLKTLDAASSDLPADVLEQSFKVTQMSIK